ncbi:MAG: ATP-binding cassette domain-containing protein [Bacteroidota bacterium]
MSEKILKALMQLFAIIAQPSSDGESRRSIVAYFLSRQLNQSTVDLYLQVFDDYYNAHQEKLQEKSRRKKRFSSSSVRVLKICTQINKELTQKQKYVVLVQLLEFVKSGGNISDQEMAFIETVADTFHIIDEDFVHIRDFALLEQDNPPQNKRTLLISKHPPTHSHEYRFFKTLSLQGDLWVIEVASANMYFMRYLGASELYLNGQLLEQDKAYVLNNGASIRNSRMSPIYYGDIVGQFNIDRIKSRIQFTADNISYTFRTGETGLNPMSFTQESGKLVGIMGASGAGKSTLLNVLNGTHKPTQGKITVNTIDIHANKENVKGLIGHVSQDDLLIEELTVFQNLYFNAKLCFDNYSAKELNEVVLATLESLGLLEIKDMVVGSPLNKKISGGQRKRLNIALELIREPAVLFLDEPTSGLSSRDSENIMDLLKELTLKGKLVFVVIHQPSSDIFKMFDQLLILDQGGFLIYDGDPIDSIIYFKSSIQHANWNESECHCCGNVNPEQVFNIIETKVVDEYGNFTSERRFSPVEWYEKFVPQNSPNQPPEVSPSTDAPLQLPEISFNVPGRLKQWAIFAKRDVLAKLSNRQYMIINMIESPILAFLLAYIVRYYSVSNEEGYRLMNNSNLPVYIFMAVIVALFIGLTVSAEEIIKDRKILKREQFLNLSWGSYLLSKVGVLFVLSAIQALLFVLIGNSIMGIRGMYWEYWLVLFSAWAFANMLGLVISDSFKTVITIYILIPFLIIPQLILSGVIVKYEKLNPDISSPRDIPFYGEIIAARWAYEALAVYQFKENDYEKLFYRYDKSMSIADFHKNYWLRTMNNSVDYCLRHLEDPDERFYEDLQLLRNEIKKELKGPSGELVTFDHLSVLTPEKISATTLKQVKTYLNRVNRYYIKLYNKANQLKDEIIQQYQSSPEGRATFMALKANHYNEDLAELVKNSNEINRIVKYKSQLIQKMDPIFLTPTRPFIKAHFYAPQKRLFGELYSTFNVNVGVLWGMTLITFFLVYFRVLHHVLQFFGNYRRPSSLSLSRNKS